jgi:hypothetical protein
LARYIVLVLRKCFLPFRIGFAQFFAHLLAPWTGPLLSCQYQIQRNALTFHSAPPIIEIDPPAGRYYG